MRTRIIALHTERTSNEPYWVWERWEAGTYRFPATASRYHLGRVVKLEPTDEGGDAA